MANYYVTTPIYYVNDSPHAGHAYTTIIADCLARYRKLKGDNVFFLTGTDEHGQKVARIAEQRGMKPIQLADKVSAEFKEAWKALSIEFDDFIRTTEARHEKVVKAVFQELRGNDDFYLSTYEGLYCEGCEKYLMRKELVNGTCPLHPNHEPVKLSEENYYFKFSKYKEKVKKAITSGELEILPVERKHEVLSFLENFEDFAVSRPNVPWAVPLPFDEKHYAYVWIDALINYISALGYPKGKNFKTFWPADVHIIGKDILRFHAIMWPAMLLSLGVKLPKKQLIHGYFTVNGQKMSKSLGNVTSPIKLVKAYGADSVRYHLLREIPMGSDGDFSESSLKDRHNNELANELGNLLNRTLVLIEKNCKGIIPKARTNPDLARQLRVQKIEEHINAFELHRALQEIFSFVSACNKFVNESKPWELKGKAQEEALYSLADSLRVLAILLYPFIPNSSEEACRQLGVKLGSWKDCAFNQLKPGTKVNKGEVLFKKLA